MIPLKSSVGIEIGGKDLRLAVMRSSFGKLRLAALHRIPDFLSLDEEGRKKAIKTLVRNNRIPAARVYLSLSREQGIVRQIDLPSDIGQKLSEVAKLQVETLSPWPLDEIYWDFSPEPPKKNRKFSRITIAFIPRAVLDPWTGFFKSVGLPLSGATLSSLAYGHGATALWQGATPTIVLHREPSYTEGILVNGSHVAAMTVPSETAVAPRLLLDRLLSTAKLHSVEGSRLVVCGGDLDRSVLDGNPRLPIENAKPDSAADFGPIATALLPLKDSGFRSNLVPPAMRYRESRMRLIPTYVLGLLVILTGLLLLARDPYQNMVYASRLDDEIRKIAPQVSEVNVQESELNQLSERYRALTAQLQNHDYNIEAMRELARILPATAFLAGYSYQDGVITLSGFAPSASEIQSVLENSPMFGGVEFTTSVSRDGSGKDRFTLKMLIEGRK